MGLILASFSFFSLLSGNFLSDFQIALTHSILKLKAILMPPDKMSRNGEKNVQVENLIWCILTALRRHLKTPNLLKDPVECATDNTGLSVTLYFGGRVLR